MFKLRVSYSFLNINKKAKSKFKYNLHYNISLLSKYGIFFMLISFYASNIKIANINIAFQRFKSNTII